PCSIIQLEIIIHQKRLARRDYGLAVESPDIARRILAAFGRLFPGGVFAFVKNVFRVRKGRHPPPIAQQRIPSAVVDVQVSAKYVVDVLEAKTGRMKPVKPRLLWEIERGWIAL